MTESRANIIIGSTGVPGEYEEKGTAAKPFRIDPTGGTTQPISATALPLPTGAATGAKQDTGNVALANIDATTDAALDATLSSRATAAAQTDGTQKAIIRGGAKGTTPAADITSSHIDDNRQGIDTRNYGTGTNDSQQVEGLAAEGVAVLGNPVWAGGYDGTLVRALRLALDDTLYRLQTEAKIAKGASALVHADAIDTAAGRGRLKVTLYSADGDPVASPSVSSSIKNNFVKNGTAESLLVNGSVTPVVFEYLADATYDVSLQEIKFTLVANTIPFGSDYFGGLVGGPLTNGMLVEVISNGVTISIYNLRQNESFVNFASPGGFEWVVSSKDMMASDYVIGGGLKLHKATGDKVRVTVRDNITSAGVYFKCFVKGNLLGA